MNKKRLILLSGISTASIAIAVSALAFNNGFKIKEAVGTDTEYSITINADDVTTSDSYVSGNVVINTDQLHNPITFSFTNLKRNGDYLEFKGSNDGTFGNSVDNEIFGIKGIDIYSKADNDPYITKIKWGWKDGLAVDYTYDANIY